MTATIIRRPNDRPAGREPTTHLFRVGQAVRLKAGFGRSSPAAGVFHITGTLPPRGGSPQYRVRNEAERHERVTTQDSLEAVETSRPSDHVTLIERTFGHG